MLSAHPVWQVICLAASLLRPQPSQSEWSPQPLLYGKDRRWETSPGMGLLHLLFSSLIRSSLNPVFQIANRLLSPRFTSSDPLIRIATIPTLLAPLCPPYAWVPVAKFSALWSSCDGVTFTISRRFCALCLILVDHLSFPVLSPKIEFSVSLQA